MSRIDESGNPRNPFSGVNASQLDVNSVLEYWCDPFGYNLFTGIKESDIYEEKMNIVFAGGRSTGKSMFLRYWSYPVQLKKSQLEGKNFFDILRQNNGIGFYFRIDGPTLRSFFGNGLGEAQWMPIFTHYFELIIAREYLNALEVLIGLNDGISKEVDAFFLEPLCEILGIERADNLAQIVHHLNKCIRDVDLYRGNVAFHKTSFLPESRGFPSQSLSFGVAELILQKIKSFSGFNIVILLDEYENFLEYQQSIINTLLRFTKPQIKFRIGMRLEGFRTYRMIAEEDFVKEGREYRQVVLEESVGKNREYSEFLKEVAAKRLDSIPEYKDNGICDIRKILGETEDLEEEAREIAKADPHKISQYFTRGQLNHEVDSIRYPSNPLFEVQNFVWLSRGISPNIIKSAMLEYIGGISSENSEKYKNDYINKYKLSYLFILCSIYKKNKMYYSFNTFSFLSSGIVGNFIELCRRSFAIAVWAGDDSLLSIGKISKENQSKSALDFSIAEKQQVSRIEQYGTTIAKFVENIGNTFRFFHTDIRIRYPETNQIAVGIDTIQNDSIRMAMKAAIKWSVIQKKPRLQRIGPHEQLQDTYILNRIFAPCFQFSYRTRGGKSIALTESLLLEIMTKTPFEYSRFLPRSNNEGDNLDLFDSNE